MQIKGHQAINRKTELAFSDNLRRVIDEYWKRFEKKERVTS